MKINSTVWVNIIPTVALGFFLTCCSDKSTSVPEVEYSAKIVERWQGTVSNLQEILIGRIFGAAARPQNNT
jgi:hypothetical protein